jgi:hypothetical protein
VNGPLDTCRHCRTVLLAGSAACLRCGLPGEAATADRRGCPVCGRAAAHDARFCAGCRQSVERVGRVVTTALLHDPPKPPAPEQVWVDRPTFAAFWPAVVAVAAVLALLAGFATIRDGFPGF